MADYRAQHFRDWANGKRPIPGAPNKLMKDIAVLSGARDMVAKIEAEAGDVRKLPLTIYQNAVLRLDAAAKPTVGPWIVKGAEVFAGGQKIIRAGAFVLEGNLKTFDSAFKNAVKSLGVSAQAVQFGVGSIGAAAGLVGALAGGNAQAIIGQSIHAISGVIAGIAPWGTAAAAMMEAGLAIWGFFAVNSPPPPPAKLGGFKWSTLQRNAEQGRILKETHAEILGLFVSGTKLGGEADIAGNREAMHDFVRRMWREALQRRASGTPIEAVRNIALCIGYMEPQSGKPLWQDPNWTPSSYLPQAYELTSYAQPRVVLRQALTYYALAKLAMSDDDSYTAAWARGEGGQSGAAGLPTLHQQLAKRLLPLPKYDLGLGYWVHTPFPVGVLKE